MQLSTDEHIARRVQNGDREAFAQLIDRYEEKMMRYARKFLFGYDEAQDVVQDVFLKAYTNIKSFDTTRQFSPWLYRIAHNLFINVIRKKGREPLSFFDPDTIFPYVAGKEATDTELKQTELKEIMEACLNQLEAKYREPLILYYYEDMDYAAISSIMRIPVSTVGVRLRRAKQRLRELYLSYEA